MSLAFEATRSYPLYLPASLSSLRYVFLRIRVLGYPIIWAGYLFAFTCNCLVQKFCPPFSLWSLFSEIQCWNIRFHESQCVKSKMYSGKKNLSFKFVNSGTRFNIKCLGCRLQIVVFQVPGLARVFQSRPKWKGIENKLNEANEHKRRGLELWFDQLRNQKAKTWPNLSNLYQ